MAGVASDSLGALACDEVYVHTRKQQGRHKARNVEEGLQQGVEALGRALAGGITGTKQLAGTGVVHQNLRVYI